MPLHAVARLDQLDEHHPIRVKAGDQAVVLVRLADQVRAYQADCPHAGAPLEDGAVCEHRLICPWHKAAFALDDGQLCEPPALTDLKRYPAHVDAGTVWVDDQPVALRTPAPLGQDRCLLVVGGGAGGCAAVGALHAKGYAGRLVWLDPQENPSYDRTALSKFVIAGDMLPEQTPPLLDDTVQHSADLVHLRQAVTHVDTQARTVTLSDGQHLAYDGLLLATGATPQRPAIAGADLPGCFVLRSRADAAQVLDAARQHQRVVIIGDSFIGLEAASALRQLGLQVHVVSRHPVPLAEVLGERIGLALRELHQQHGVVFHAPTEPLRLEGTPHVQAVVLASGERIATDLVLFGTGVRPATEFAAGLPMADDHSLRVDAGMRAVDGVWAVGDMVTFPFAGQPTRIEHWRVAQQQARIAAANLLGERQVYADVPFFWTYHYGKNIEVLGHARRWNHLELSGDPHGDAFIALQCQDDQVAAVIASGHERATAALSQCMKQPLSRPQALKLIERYAP